MGKIARLAQRSEHLHQYVQEVDRDRSPRRCKTLLFPSKARRIFLRKMHIAITSFLCFPNGLLINFSRSSRHISKHSAGYVVRTYHSTLVKLSCNMNFKLDSNFLICTEGTNSQNQANTILPSPWNSTYAGCTPHIALDVQT